LVAGRAVAPKSPPPATVVEAGENENAGVEPAADVNDNPAPERDAPVSPKKTGDIA